MTEPTDQTTTDPATDSATEPAAATPEPLPAKASSSRFAYSTRALMVCAALAAAFTVLFIGYTWAELAILPVAPLVIVFTSGLWFALPLLAMLYVQRPGAALITAAIAGLIASFASPYGWQLLAFAAVYGLIVEIPFAVTAWRRFGVVMTGIVGLVFGAGSVGAYWMIFTGAGFGTAMLIVMVIATVIAFLAWAFAAWALARALRRVLPAQQ